MHVTRISRYVTLYIAFGIIRGFPCFVLIAVFTFISYIVIPYRSENDNILPFQILKTSFLVKNCSSVVFKFL